MRPTPPPADDLGDGPVHLDAGQPVLEIPTETGRPVTIWVRSPRGEFGVRSDPDVGRLENVLGVPRPWIGDVRTDPRTGGPLARAQRLRAPRGLPAIQELPVQVRGVSVSSPAGRPLVEDVSLDLAPGELLAVAGPAEAAATALLAALTAQAPFSGRISYGAVHVTDDTADAVRSVIGIVPATSLLSGPMPLGRALAHTAALRQPSASRADRRAAVAEVVDGLGLRSAARIPLADLDPATARRASIAMEVLARVSVIVLDDPTGGLDPDAEAELLRLLQALAQVGRRTIVMTTHSPLAMSVADNLVLLDVTRSGSARLAYHGPPEEAATRFGVADWDFAAMYAELADRQSDWSGDARPVLAAFDPDSGAGPSSSRRSWPSLAPAVRRLAARRLEDFWWRGESVLGLLAPGVVLVILALALLGWGNLDPNPPTAEGTFPRLLLGFVTLAAVLPPSVVAAREIVRERRAVERDVSVGLRPAAYVLGRYAALVAAGLIPALVPLLLFLGQGGRHGVSAAAVVLVLGAMASSAFGLAISAAGRRESRVLWGVGGALVAQVLLCGAFVAIEGSPIQPLAAVTPGYWVFRGLAGSQDLASLDAGCRAGEAFCSTHWAVGEGIGAAVLALVLLVIAGLATAAALLRRPRR